MRAFGYLGALVAGAALAALLWMPWRAATVNAAAEPAAGARAEPTARELRREADLLMGRGPEGLEAARKGDADIIQARLLQAEAEKLEIARRLEAAAGDIAEGQRQLLHELRQIRKELELQRPEAQQ